ncbi:flagellar motor protein MotD [Methylobacter psychrophilus]|uniref:flagellar motor protein MotD n=1 Tax=Methylobacter psychrophilus TaxID=96941 RepID=UPI0021D4A377|nr:flagellar motor protein MotD [Methylobacter psychrophilus]
MARKPYHEEPEQNDRWLVSYADFITLLFALFVVMYAMSSTQGIKFKQLSSSLSQALANREPDQPPATTLQPMAFKPADIMLDNPDPDKVVLLPLTVAMPAPVPMLMLIPDPTALIEPVIENPPMTTDEIKHQTELRQEKVKMKDVANQLELRLASLINQDKVRITESSRGISVEINASILFAPADAVFNSDSKSMLTLQSIADVLTNQPYLIHVEGHTDDLPINTQQYPSNWELSSARAGSVVRLLIGMGIQSQRLAAIGYAANRPITSNDSADGRLRNRRVQLMILNDAESGDAAIDTPVSMPMDTASKNLPSDLISDDLNTLVLPPYEGEYPNISTMPDNR